MGEVVDLQKKTDTTFWLRCPCGSHDWMMEVDAPEFTSFLKLVCSQCFFAAPVDFKIVKDKEEKNVGD